MNFKIIREVAFLMVPVLALGGYATSKVIEGKRNSGPKRVEFSQFERVELDPYYIKQGYDWAAKSSTRMVGHFDAPEGWVESGAFTPFVTNDTHLAYRRGGVWKKVMCENGERPLQLTFDGGYTFLVDLKTVPQDADEVRLRGRFAQTQTYKGPIPEGWTPPRNLKPYSPCRFLELESEPFDVPIKDENDPMPESPA